MGRIRVCYVVNAVGETSVPADIARAVDEYTDVDIELLAWFSADSFDGDNRLSVACLSAPDNVLGIDTETARRAGEYLREYDVVQAHHNHSGSFAKVLAARHGVPTVSREGNMRKGFTIKGRVANGLTNSLAERVVCNSRAVYESFTAWERRLISDRKVRFIPNGVDFERIRAAVCQEGRALVDDDVDRDATLIGSAGMLTEQKDHETLIAGMPRIIEQSSEPVELVIAGDGPLMTELRAQASTLGVADRVHFLGLMDRTEVYQILDAIDIYAMPSRWEGFSAAAVEALALKNACVFSDIPPFRQPYDDVALFHPVGNKAGLADQVLELINDEERRSELAKRGHSLVSEEYTMEAIAKKYRDLYHELC